MFIVQAEKSLWLWVGAEFIQTNYGIYMQAIEKHINLLQKFERANQRYTLVQQGQESEEFWHALELSEKPQEPYRYVEDWTRAYIDVSLPLLFINLLFLVAKREYRKGTSCHCGKVNG